MQLQQLDHGAIQFLTMRNVAVSWFCAFLQCVRGAHNVHKGVHNHSTLKEFWCNAIDSLCTQQPTLSPSQYKPTSSWLTCLLAMASATFMCSLRKSCTTLRCAHHQLAHLGATFLKKSSSWSLFEGGEMPKKLLNACCVLDSSWQTTCRLIISRTCCSSPN